LYRLESWLYFAAKTVPVANMKTPVPIETLERRCLACACTNGLGREQFAETYCGRIRQLKNKSNRLTYLDGLRGLAALGVFWAHAPMLLLSAQPDHNLWMFFSHIGDSGVELFDRVPGGGV
jgi:hypothetical protein